MMNHKKQVQAKKLKSKTQKRRKGREIPLENQAHFNLSAHHNQQLFYSDRATFDKRLGHHPVRSVDQFSTHRHQRK